MQKNKKEKILAIETSCDDTSIAIMEVFYSPKQAQGKDLKKSRKINFRILSSIVSSQTKIHEKWGGIYPSEARREHQKTLVPILEKSLKQANLLLKKNSSGETKTQCLKFEFAKQTLKKEQELQKNLIDFLQKYKKPRIDKIAIIVGPGLSPCLWVGVNFAKTLACYWNMPIIPVNHIEAHIMANFISARFQSSGFEAKNLFPAICLIVSGGHTQLALMKGIGNYKIIGETRDDAAGECFDKTARVLGLGFPGGPAIELLASQFNPKTKTRKTGIKNQGQISKNKGSKIILPRPMLNSNDYDFSFSGLKTAVLYNALKKKRKTKSYKQEMCKEIQQSIIDVLLSKTLKAAREFKTKSIILGGGVTANKELRNQFAEKIKALPSVNYLAPDINFCGDNAAMAAITAFFKKERGWKKIKANANLKLQTNA